MATVSDICLAALRKVALVPQGQSAEAGQMADAVDAFNRMVHAWKLAGVDLSHTDKAAADAFPFAAEYEEGCVYLLASRLAPDYVVPVTFDADDWFRKFQAANTTITAASMPKSLTRMPSRYWRDTRVR